jgi:MYXO-CTERM domain-containing protein
MTKRSALLYASACAVFVTLPALDASAFCQTTTEGNCDEGTEIGEFLEWERACLSYAIDERGSQWMTAQEVDGAVNLAFEAWENVDCGGGNPPSVVLKPLQPSTCQRAEFNCNGNVNTIAFLDPWEEPCASMPYDPQAFAVTVVWRSAQSGRIFDADIMINDAMSNGRNAGGPYANCPDTGCPPSFGTNPGPADLRSIVTHEVGHVLGIGHSEVEEATMFLSTDRRSVENRTLHPDDEAAVCSIYPPGTLEQSCDATPYGGLELDCEQKACTTSSCSVGSSSSGCSASRDPANAPWAGMLAGVFGLIVLRRRPRVLDVRS